MGDHFALIVDRLLTESTLEAAIESRNRSLQATVSAVDGKTVLNSSPNVDLSSPRKIVECRICQDEDEDSNMETPCYCCGSLKYAHRRCVQRWCNEKGNTTCEICCQQFKPGYTAPAPVFQIGHIPMNLRENWEISRRELDNSRFIAVVSTDRSLLDSHSDEYSVSPTRICYHVVAAIFMLLLILRHALPVLLNGTSDFSFLLFMLLLRIVGIILPIYIIVKTMTLPHRHWQQQAPNSPSTRSDEETDHSVTQPQPHMINIH